ncbi:MAG: hypothetical protein KAY24_01280 [Candidatus Eisenbacteria sp.]|nr:hypothetical protein [Candidatus Eisenbacteria bacterium]
MSIMTLHLTNAAGTDLAVETTKTPQARRRARHAPGTFAVEFRVGQTCSREKPQCKSLGKLRKKTSAVFVSSCKPIATAIS